MGTSKKSMPTWARKRGLALDEATGIWSMRVGRNGGGGTGCTLSPAWNKQFILGLSSSTADAVRAAGDHVAVEWQCESPDSEMQLRITPGVRGYKVSDRGGRWKIHFPRQDVELAATVALEEPEMNGGDFVFAVPGAKLPDAA